MRTPEDEDRAIELERQSDVARLLAQIEARLEALRPPERSTAEIIEQLLDGAKRHEAREVMRLLEAWLGWGRRLEAELEFAEELDDVLDVLEQYAREGFTMKGGRDADR